ncbi:uncharacterized protein JCM6883_003142 [Sporobolomyces salmoneus]|uniref:uncharacterized protein n=1 Tax=Sporobolomyces salmoneus TaxID=183962 RepID=UPI00316FCFF2
MSSFDQSRGFTIPSSFTRQESWNASDGWNSVGTPSAPPSNAPPLASSISSSNGFRNYMPPPATNGREMDYSVIDSEQLVRSGGFNEAHNGDLLDETTSREWELPPQEKCSVHLSPQLEGTILQKHHIWILTSNQAKSSVERRYSDFVWLLDCLLKRYPFRLLPTLPPKSIQYQGHFIGQDEGFLERRKRGLERFVNSLTNHPVVRKDAILQKFLNEPTDLTSYRKNPSNYSLLEESTTLTLSSSQLSSLPRNLEAKLQSVRAHLPLQIETWTKLSQIVDRLAHRRLNQSVEWDKFAKGLEVAVEIEQGTSEAKVNGILPREEGGEQGEGLEWRPREMKKLEKELGILSKSVKEISNEEEESAKRLLEGFVEDVKRHRELYLNLRDLFHRQSTLGIDHLDKLEKRLSSNVSKLELLQSTTPSPPSYALDFDKLSTAVEQDKRSIEQTQRRREFIKWCVWKELNWVFRSTSLLRRNMKSFVGSEKRFGMGLERVWKQLEDGGLGDESI